MQCLIFFEYVDFELCLFIKFCEKYNPARLLHPACLLSRWEYSLSLYCNFVILSDLPTDQESNVPTRVTPRPASSHKQPEVPVKGLKKDHQIFTCPFCEKEFYKEKNLYLHKKFRHNGKIIYPPTVKWQTVACPTKVLK